MDPIVLILGCQKYKTNLLAAIDRMKLPSYRVIGLVGTTEPTSFDGTILSLQVEDSYEYLPRKVHAAFCWIHEHFPETVGIFKTDDDIFFRNQNDLAVAIQTHAQVPFWGTVVAHCSANQVDISRVLRACDDKTLRPRHHAAHYCYGHGYWVSKEAIPTVCASTEHRDAFLEDVTTAYILNKKGWYPKYVSIPYEERGR